MPAAPDPRNAARRSRAAVVSLVIGVVVFAVKVAGWAMTGSSAILSDALESVVNVVAAIFAIFAVRFAAQPADRDHPYGHGKIEFLSAAFEGGLVLFAAITIAYAAARAMIEGATLRAIDVGLVLTAAAGAANLLLGAWLLHTAKAVESPALTADAQHVLSDVWTTVGVLIGLALVRLTGRAWFDPLTAIAIALLLARTGVRLVRESADALLDREEPRLLARLVAAINESHVDGIGGIHHLRAIRTGNTVHVDAHVFVPQEWSVAQAHGAAARLEEMVREKSGLVAEIVLHIDPSSDEVEAHAPISVEEAVGPPRIRHAQN